MKKIIGGLVLGLTVAFNSYAQKPAVVTSNEEGWQKIGETTASFKMQNESISILGADEFTAIKLKVKDAPLTIERLQVFYESGEMEEINIEKDVTPDAESDVITLKHPDRDIQKIAFTYKTSANNEGEKAEVEVFGLKTNQPAGEDAYRTDGDQLEKKADEASDDVKQEVNETRREVREESREIRDEASTTSEQIENEADETASEVKKEVDETAEDVSRESREAEKEIDQKAENTKEDVEEAAEKTSSGVAEGVNEIGADLRDEKVEGKIGPGGETIYIEESGKYYYIDNHGKKTYIEKSKLKNKDDDQ